MGDFLKTFLREEARTLAPDGQRALHLAAFGKHPGWNDHIEENPEAPDLGLQTQSLILAKTVFYVRGIGRNIDSGAWEKLEPAQQVPGFAHAFLWQANDQFLIGRLWSSSDGKGRKAYPMVVAAHALGVSLHWALAVALPRLELLREECCAVTTASEVMVRLNRSREDLRRLLAEDARSTPRPQELLARFASHPQFGPGADGLLRVLYQLRSQVEPYTRGRFNPRGGPEDPRSQDLRVPAAGADAYAVFTPWSRLLAQQVDPAVPVLFTWPVGGDWLDIVIGEPQPEQLSALRITPVKLPCVSEIPFNIDDSFRRQAQVMLSQLVSGECPKPGGTSVLRLFGSLFKRP
jgi:hypothetical protein